MSFRRSVLALSVLLLAGSVSGFNTLSDLVVNYGDFSHISSIAVGFDYVYFGTTSGIIRYKIGEHTWDDPLTGIYGLRGNNIQSISVTPDDNRIWVKTESGIFEYSRAIDQWFPAEQIENQPGQARHIESDQLYFPPEGYNYLPGRILVDNDDNRYPLTDIVDDGWTNLWIGTWGLGALRADNNNLRLEMIPYGLIQPDISTIYLDGETLWIGGQAQTDGRNGVSIFDWRHNRFDYIEARAGLVFAAVGINDITANENNIFIATDDGVWVVDRDDFSIKETLSRNSGLPDDRILKILAVGDTLYAGSEYGLGILDLSDDSTRVGRNLLLTSLTITSLRKIDGDLWIGTSQGAYRMNLSGGKLGHLKIPEVTRAVNDIDDDGTKIWLALDNSLVTIDKETAEIETYPEIFNYGGARAIAVRDTITAVATPEGLLLYYNGPHPRRQLYSLEDGLMSNDIKDLLFDGDYIWLGSDRGLTRFFYRHRSLGY